MNIRIGPYRLTKGELSGAFADLGLLIPLEAALISINGLNPTMTLLGIGILYVGTGWYFRIPMPVQPLKAFAAVAIAAALNSSVIAAGALLMSLALFVLGITGLVELLHRTTPPAVIRGIQFGLGLILIKGGFELMVDKPFALGVEKMFIPVFGALLPLGTFVGAASLVLLVVLLRWPWFPPSIAVLALGVLVGFFLQVSALPPHWTLGPAPWEHVFPSLSDFRAAWWLLVIPQLPLTLANSVLATADAARVYYAQQAGRTSTRSIALSIAIGNLWAGLLGGLPNCHGSGGLTAHYRLGARTPLATAFLGIILIIVAVLFGNSALAIRSFIPWSTFGALLLYVGVQHLLLGLQVSRVRDYVVVAMVGVATMAFQGNLAVGAGVGMLASKLLASAVRTPVEQV